MSASAARRRLRLRRTARSTPPGAMCSREHSGHRRHGLARRRPHVRNAGESQRRRLGVERMPGRRPGHGGGRRVASAHRVADARDRRQGSAVAGAVLRGFHRWTDVHAAAEDTHRGVPHHPQIAVDGRGAATIAWDETGRGPRQVVVARLGGGAAARITRLGVTGAGAYPIRSPPTTPWWRPGPRGRGRPAPCTSNGFAFADRQAAYAFSRGVGLRNNCRIMASSNPSLPTALVTGAGSGIGRGIALALADAGFHVAVNDLEGSTGRTRPSREIACGGHRAYACAATCGSAADVTGHGRAGRAAQRARSTCW